MNLGSCPSYSAPHFLGLVWLLWASGPWHFARGPGFSAQALPFVVPISPWQEQLFTSDKHQKPPIMSSLLDFSQGNLNNTELLKTAFYVSFMFCDGNLASVTLWTEQREHIRPATIKSAFRNILQLYILLRSYHFAAYVQSRSIYQDRPYTGS